MYYFRYIHIKGIYTLNLCWKPWKMPMGLWICEIMWKTILAHPHSLWLDNFDRDQLDCKGHLWGTEISVLWHHISKSLQTYITIMLDKPNNSIVDFVVKVTFFKQYYTND